MNQLFPLNLDITGRFCVVVGGGSVALRKVMSLLVCGAKIRVISPVLKEELEKLVQRGQVEWLDREYERGDLQGAFMAFAATDNPEIQNQVREEASCYSVLLNRVDDPETCDFQVPASFCRGELLLTVSTGGGSPALASRIRQELESQYGEGYAAVVGLLTMLRKAVLNRDGDFRAHAALFNSLLDRGIVEMVLAANWFDLQMVLLETLPPEVDGVELLRKFLDRYDTSETPL